MTQSDYYQILGLRRDAPSQSAAQVKRAYRTALLSHHPDKTIANEKDAKAPGRGDKLTIDKIALAYKTLSEPSLKAEYDRWLASKGPAESSGTSGDRILHTGLETVDLDDLEYDEETQSWNRGCRCGVGGYAVTEDDLEKNLEDRELIIGCKGCSLWLRVLFSVEE